MGKINSKTFFNDNEKKEIEEAIKEVEKKSSGEIVVIAAKESESYKDIEIIYSILFGILFAGIIQYFLTDILFFFNNHVLKASDAFIQKLVKLPFYLKDEFRYILLYGLIYFIPIGIVLFFILRLVFISFPSLKGHFLSKERMEYEVKEYAFRMFYDHGLYKTVDNTGVLFLISILEHRVYILADKGIYEKIKQKTLDDYAESISKGIAKGNGAASLCEAIKSCGAVLAKNFPIKPDDKNELSDKIIFE